MHLVFGNFFNSPALIDKLLGGEIYTIGTVRSNREQMPKLKEDKKMYRVESGLYYSKNIICCKWYDNKPALLLATNFVGLSWVSKVMRQVKGSKHLFFVLTSSIFTAMGWVM